MIKGRNFLAPSIEHCTVTTGERPKIHVYDADFISFFMLTGGNIAVTVPGTDALGRDNCNHGTERMRNDTYYRKTSLGSL